MEGQGDDAVRPKDQSVQPFMPPATAGGRMTAVPTTAEPTRPSPASLRHAVWLAAKALALIEFASAAIIVGEIGLLLLGVLSRYVFHSPLVWIDEVATVSFLWLVILGSSMALARDEHMRLSTVVARFPASVQGVLRALTILIPLIFMLMVAHPALEYARDEGAVTTPALGISNFWRAVAMFSGFVLMIPIAAWQLLSRCKLRDVVAASLVLCALIGLIWWAQPQIVAAGNYSLLLFFGLIVGFCVLIGTPIGFSFAIATCGYLLTSTEVPLSVVVSRMDEGVSNVVLLAVPGFIVLGMFLGISGMARAMLDFLLALLANVRGGLSYVLLAAIYVVSGISGSKAADMAAVAPALFPEMKARGIPPGEMVSQLAAAAAMSETIPPSLVLIAVGSVTGVSIAALFAGGLLPALVLALALAVVSWFRSGGSKPENATRVSAAVVMRTFAYGLPALGLPFLMRFLVVEGIATATEVSTVAIVYVIAVGSLVYRQFEWRRVFPILVETASLSGAVLFIIGAASAMGWALTQSGMSRDLVSTMRSLPGGAPVFMLTSIVAFIILGTLLEGIPAMVLFGPMLFPVARAFGIHEVQYAMVAILAMGVGLFSPPFGIGFYSACAIGRVDPADASKAIWPYMAALGAGLLIVAGVPWISTVFVK